MQTSAVIAVKPLIPIADVIQLIPVDKIDPSPRNARKEFPKEYIAELGASIARDGQQQAGKVRPLKNGRFQLIYGECRWRGAKGAGVELYKAVVEEMDDAKADRLCLIENLKRRDLSVFEEAEHLKMLHETHKVKIDDLAVQVGISVRGVYEALKLATLHKTVRDLVTREEKPMPVSLAKLISRLPQSQQIPCSESAEDYDGWLTHDQLEEHIRDEYLVDLRQAPFAVKLTGFPCLAATCADCPRNARNAKDEFPELKGADFCLSPENYKKKVDAFTKAVVADAKKSGKNVLSDQESEQALTRSAGPYVPLSTKVWVGNELKALSEVLPKKAELEKSLAIDDEGQAVEVAKKADLQAVLEKAGRTAIANSYELTGRHSSSGGSSNDEQAKRRKKLLERRAVAALAINALADHQHTTAADDVFMKLIGLGLTQGRIDNDGLQLMLKQWYGSEKKTDYGPDAAAKLLDAAKGAELRRTMVRVAMAGGLTAGGTWSDSHARELLGALKLYGLKLDRFQDEAKKVKAAKEAEKKAPKSVAGLAPFKKDPLDSPAVAKAKAKKSAAAAKKGGAK